MSLAGDTRQEMSKRINIVSNEYQTGKIAEEANSKDVACGSDIASIQVIDESPFRNETLEATLTEESDRDEKDEYRESE